MFKIWVWGWNLWNFQASFVYLSLNDFLAKISFLRKQGNASSRPWYNISRSWRVLHEQSPVRFDSARQSGLLTVLYRDRDIIYHDCDHAHDQPSRSWQLVRQILGCSRPFITIVTIPFQLVTFKKNFSNWFIFGLNLGFCLAFWDVSIFGIRAGIRSKLGFWRLKVCWMLCILIVMRSFVLNHGV